MSPQPLNADQPTLQASGAEQLRAIASGSEAASEELHGRYRVSEAGTPTVVVAST